MSVPHPTFYFLTIHSTATPSLQSRIDNFPEVLLTTPTSNINDGNIVLLRLLDGVSMQRFSLPGSSLWLSKMID
jgi:hypothetical protein